MNDLIQLLAAGVGSLGFAMIFNARGRRLFWAALGGVVSWGAYLLALRFWPSEAGCSLIAAFILTVYGETMARVQHTPATVYVVAGAIPMVPGASLYRTMSAAVAGDTHAAVAGGAKTLLLAAAIAAGILACMMLWSIVERGLRRVWRE